MRRGAGCVQCVTRRIIEAGGRIWRNADGSGLLQIADGRMRGLFQARLQFGIQIDGEQ